MSHWFDISKTYPKIPGSNPSNVCRVIHTLRTWAFESQAVTAFPLGNRAGLELVWYETSCMPDLVRDSSNTTGHRLRTGDETNNVAQRIEPLVRLMPSWGVKTPPSCDFGPRNLGASNELNELNYCPGKVASPPGERPVVVEGV
eukprot:CAMPEP_0113676300 /NCGR_PEP_ID=MMETSP0038_2-20120614/8558_1 /TAXON_ID=2898 /ORGANISM="Cryptomonas paramecium" /LENGTH=143 /DNA_ID=CAMNT_0000593297 /DNA_START=964 /DNA_END=1392 /DNA_ORIENTATION=- /assembly_acc=CAM_ASM_000170